MKITSVLAAFFAVVVVSPVAIAGQFTSPEPTFDAALAAAKAAKKPLLLDFSASWCKPCKMMADDLDTPEGRLATSAVYMVVYDGDSGDIGSELFAKHGCRSFPSLVAFDATGKEIARRDGYPGLETFTAWLADVSQRMRPIDEQIAMAKKTPDGAANLAVAKRLFALGRRSEAIKFFERAARATTTDAGAQAAWTLTKIKIADGQTLAARRGAEAFLRAHPKASESTDAAIRYLASIENPPTALLDRIMTRNIPGMKVEDVNSYAYIAIKAKANKAARKAADMLMAEAEPDYVDTAAEVLLALGEPAKAIALSEKAVAAAVGEEKVALAKNLARFKRGDVTTDELKFYVPSLDVGRIERLGGVQDEAVQQWQAFKRVKTRIESQINENCWKVAGSALGYYAYLIPARDGRPVQIVARPGLDKKLVDCAAKYVAEATLPESVTEPVELYALFSPKAFNEAVERATKAAGRDCTKAVGGTFVISGSAGEKVQAAGGEGKACVEKAFANVGALSFPIVRVVKIVSSDEGKTASLGD